MAYNSKERLDRNNASNLLRRAPTPDMVTLLKDVSQISQNFEQSFSLIPNPQAIQLHAHKLATHGLSLEQECIWLEDTTDFLMAVLADDVIQSSN